MTATTAPMFSTSQAAAKWHMPLPAHYVVFASEDAWWAALDDVAASALDQAGFDCDPDDTGRMDEIRNTVNDTANNAWQEGISHDEWVSATLRRLRRDP